MMMIMVTDLIKLWIIFFLIGAASATLVMMRIHHANHRWTPIQECQVFFYFMKRIMIPGVNIYYIFLWWINLIFETNKERFFHSIVKMIK